MINPRIGALRHRTEIYTRDEIPSPSLYVTDESFTLLATVWARFIPLTGLQKIDSKQINEPITHKVFMRYRDDLNDRAWLVYGGQRFDIKTYRVIEERDRFLELMVEENETVA